LALGEVGGMAAAASRDVKLNRGRVFQVRLVQVGEVDGAQASLRSRSNQLIDALLGTFRERDSRLDANPVAAGHDDFAYARRHDPWLTCTVASVLGAEAGEVAEDVQREHRHRQVARAQVGEGIEAQHDVAMTLMLPLHYQSAEIAVHDAM